MLLEEDEGGNGVRAQANEARNPATEGPSKTLLAADIPQQAYDAVTTALSRRRSHDTGLDHVHGAADGGSDEAGEEGGCEVSADIVAHAHLLNAEALEDIVRCQLRGGHENCARRVRPYTAEERSETFGLGHLHQAVEGMAVVTALGGG